MLKCAIVHKSAQKAGLKFRYLQFTACLRLVLSDFSTKRFFSGFVLEALMKNFPGLLFARRLNELNSQLTELKELRARVEAAERRASGVPTPAIRSEDYSLIRANRYSTRHPSHSALS